MNEFDSYECPLSGNHIVEAGAGTGKTYNIQILVARMILSGIPVERILVVTFTRNATAELRERIRNILAELLAALRIGDTEPQSRAARVLAGCERQNAESHLATALRDFDSAAIYTIHGFCQRMLAENAFESNRRYGLAICTNADELMNCAVNDFVRRLLFDPDGDDGQSLAMRQFAWQFSGLSRSRLASDCSRVLKDCNARCDWDEAVTSSGIAAAARDAYDAFLKMVAAASQLVEITPPPTPGEDGWRQAVFACRNRLKQLDFALHTKDGKELRKKTSDIRKNLDSFGLALTAAGEKMLSGKSASFANDFIDSLFNTSAYGKFARAVTAAAIRQVRLDTRDAMAQEGVMTYDDMLREMRNSLENDPKHRLRDAIRQRYSCAIVDEFQDTDESQYRIFDDLFGQSPAHAFFMIGDPKQAIYSFRGGDIFTYCEARDAVSRQMRSTLTVNYRSSPGYIAAMNRFFDDSDFFTAADNGGETPQIAFNQIRDNDRVHDLQILLPGADQWPLLSAYSANGLPNEMAVRRTVDEIAQMLSCRDRILAEGRPINAGDIAVLVRAGSMGNSIEAELLARGINCSWRGAGGLLERPEAAALRCILEAIAEPRRRDRVMAMLALPVFHLDTMELCRYHDHEAGAVQGVLLKLHQQWEESTFLQMFNRLLRLTRRELLASDDGDGDRTFAQMLAGPPGESDVAIWKQLGEVIHYTALTRRLGPAETLAWLVDRLHRGANAADVKPTGNPDDDEQAEALFKRRMRTQDNAVTIMTIHGSKGLQFPVVILPQICGSASFKGDRYHDRNGVRRIMMDDDDDAQSAAQCRRESIEEQRRLLYVAITRAQYLCRIIGGLQKGPRQAGLFPDSDLPPLPVFSTPPWEKAAAETPPAASPPATAGYEPFDAPCPRGWQTCSYSSLSRNRSAVSPDDHAAPHDTEGNAEDDNDLPPPAILAPADDHDDHDAPDDADGNDANDDIPPIFLFPRGASAGEAWHKLLEQLDYQQHDPERLREYAASQLDAARQLPSNDPRSRQAMLDAAVDMIHGLLDNPLPGTRIRLGEIPPSKRRHEMNFKMRLADGNGIDCQEIRAILEDFGIAMPNGWLCTASTGEDNADDRHDTIAYRDFTLVGQIDLLFESDGKFWIVDWKTNALCQYGDRPSFERFDHHSPQCALDAEMDAHFYTLQYLLYTVAFMRWYAGLHPGFSWTEERYGQLFGGCCYIFLRGVSKASPGRGCCLRRPCWPLIDRLFRAL